MKGTNGDRNDGANAHESISKNEIHTDLKLKIRSRKARQQRQFLVLLQTASLCIRAVLVAVVAILVGLVIAVDGTARPDVIRVALTVIKIPGAVDEADDVNWTIHSYIYPTVTCTWIEFSTQIGVYRNGNFESVWHYCFPQTMI